MKAAPLDPSRGGFRLVYDSMHQETLLFGGYDFSSCSGNYNDMHSFTGASWQLEPASAPPPGRQAFAFAYDSIRNKTVLFGGIAPSCADANLKDTWEFDGAWQKSTPTANVSSARWGTGAVYDPVRKTVMIFGGTQPSAPQDLDETWEYAGVNWAMVTTAAKPSARGAVTMAYDEARSQIVLFGGQRLHEKPSADTCLFDHTPPKWTCNTDQIPPNGPPPAAAVPMAYDRNLGRVVMYIHPNSIYAPDVTEPQTWEWNGTTWKRTAATVDENPEAMVYDEKRHELLMTSGNKTWRYALLAKPCKSGGDCVNGHCVDGLCCASSSCGACESCSTVGNPGFCAPVTNQDDPDSCSGARSCDGCGKCVAR